MGFGLNVQVLHSSTLVFIFSTYFLAKISSISATPNIVFIIADDLGWDDVGFHGSEIKTPNIDRLATEGVILNNYYVQPICTPTRSAILTGRYPIHTGLQHGVITGSEPYGMPLNVTTMPEHLRKFGYKTHAIGKWHLGFCSDDYLPRKRGFDSYLGYYLGVSDYFDHYTHDGGFLGYDLHHNGSPLWNQSEVYSTELFTNQAKAIIQAHDSSAPLFMYLAYQGVHAANFGKIEAPQKYIDRFGYISDKKRKYFAGMVSAVDDGVGVIHQTLVNSGIADNTVLVFTTDNGGPTNGYDGNAACNWPLRGCKNTLWQGGVRGVGFVNSPLLKHTGYVNENLIHATDWLPTLLAIANSSPSGTDKPKKDLRGVLNHLDGFDQWEVISENSKTKRTEVLLNIDPIEKIEAIIMGDFKLIHGKVLNGHYNSWYPPPPHETNFNTALPRQVDDSLYYSVEDQAPIRSFKKSNNLDRSKHDPDEIIMKIDDQFEQLEEYFFHLTDNEKSFLRKIQNSNNEVSDSMLDLQERRVKMGIISVDCGPKPANASTNCQPAKEACLFNIKLDPCEYMNLAQDLPSVVKTLKNRIKTYRASMVPPAKKPIDPKGNPQLHGGVWQPWLKKSTVH